MGERHPKRNRVPQPSLTAASADMAQSGFNGVGTSHRQATKHTIHGASSEVRSLIPLGADRCHILAP